MVATGVLVFDDEPFPTILEGTTSGQASVLLAESNDVLVFDAETDGQVVEIPGQSDFVVFDSQARVVEEILAPADLLIVDAPPEPARVILDGSPEQDVVIITPGGLPGPQGVPGVGLPGPPGPQGPAGAGSFYVEYGFATPATTWTVVHNLNTFALNVELVDSQGEPLEGYVRSVDLNTIEIDWYYPTAGAARLFR